jgi:hypothetical protein
LFLYYIENGDPLLLNPRTRWGRGGYDWRGVRYIGGIFKDVAWPGWLIADERPAEDGTFFWGIAEEVVRSLQTGDVRDASIRDWGTSSRAKNGKNDGYRDARPNPLDLGFLHGRVGDRRRKDCR